MAELEARRIELRQELDRLEEKRTRVIRDLGLDNLKVPVIAKSNASKSDLIRIGIIGFGSRAVSHANGLGFMHPNDVESRKKSDGLKDWLARAKGVRGGSDLAWLLAQAGAGRTGREFERAFDAAEVPLAWRLDDRAGITGNALRVALAYRGAGMRRASGDPCAAIQQPLPVERCSRRTAARLLDVWRAALWARTRTVFQIEQPNLDECYLADLGGGLQFAAIGVTPHSRESWSRIPSSRSPP